MPDDERRLGLRIADLQWNVDVGSAPGDQSASAKSSPAAQMEPLLPTYRPFLVPAAELADTVISARSGPLPAIDTAGTPPVFNSGQIWQLYPWEGRRAFVFGTTLPGAESLPWRVALADEPGDNWEIVTADPLPFELGELPFPHPLAFPLAQLIAVDQLSRRGGLLLHSCGVADGERGLVFCGRSGAGKSTMGGLWLRTPNGARLLNDDRIIVRPREDGWWVHSTPWPGDIRDVQAGGAALRALFFLEQHQRSHILPLSASVVRRRLLSCTWLPLWDRGRLDATLAQIEQLAQQARGYALSFDVDPSALEAIRDAAA